MQLERCFWETDRNIKITGTIVFTINLGLRCFWETQPWSICQEQNSPSFTMSICSTYKINCFLHSSQSAQTSLNGPDIKKYKFSVYLGIILPSYRKTFKASFKRSLQKKEMHQALIYLHLEFTTNTFNWYVVMVSKHQRAHTHARL